MRRTAPGYVQLPHNHHNAHPHSQAAGAAGPRPGGTRSPAGGSPLARTSTTASYFEAGGEGNGTAAAQSGKTVSPESSSGGTSRTSASPARPPNSRTKSNSSIHSVGSLRSAGTSSSYTASSSSPSGPFPSSSTATAASHHHPATAHKHYHHHHHQHSNVPQHQQHSYRYYPGHSPAASSNSSKTTQADEIEASLRQWRNHVFPSLKAGNYVSPGQETPERDPIHPVVEPILPSIFQAGAPNAKCRVQSYSSAREFLAALTKDEVYERSWRLEMVLGQTEDMLYNPACAEGVWLAVWSGSDEDGSLLLEFCLTKLPSRPLIIISPIPMAVLPTALLQDRMLSLLNAFLGHPTIANGSGAPFSLIMGPTRAVEAFLLHFDGIDSVVEPGLEKHHHNSPVQNQHRGSWTGSAPPPAYYAKGHRASISSTSSTSLPPPADYPSTTWSPSEQPSVARERSDSAGAAAAAMIPQVTTSASSSPVANTKSATFPSIGAGGSSSSGGIHHASTAHGRTVKALLHTRIERPPPSVSLSEGFEVRLANENDDLACLTGLFQAYSATLDHFLDDYAARKALTKAISTRSVWIYHVSSLCFPGLTLIAGFLTTERRRRYRQRLPSSEEVQEDGSKRGEGSIAITAVFVNENYRGRGVAESLVRTATRFYLVGEEAPSVPSPSLSYGAKNKKPAKEAASSSESTSSESSSSGIASEASPILPSPPKEIFDFVSIYVDPKNESTCRVFSRVGYGIMDKEETVEIPIPALRDALVEQYRIEWERAGMSRRSSIAAAVAKEGYLADDDAQEEEDDVNTPGLPPIPGGLPASELANISTTTQGQDEGNEDSDHTPQGTARFTSSVVAEKPDPLDTVPIPVHSVEHVEGEAAEQDEHAQDMQEEEEESGPPEPCCRSVEDWEVVSLRNRTSEEGRRIRGSRREGEKRLSIDGPWQ